MPRRPQAAARPSRRRGPPAAAARRPPADPAALCAPLAAADRGPLAPRVEVRSGHGAGGAPRQRRRRPRAGSARTLASGAGARAMWPRPAMARGGPCLGRRPTGLSDGLAGPRWARRARLIFYLFFRLTEADKKAPLKILYKH